MRLKNISHQEIGIQTVDILVSNFIPFLKIVFCLFVAFKTTFD